MSLIQKVIFPLFSEPNGEFGASKLQKVKSMKDFLWLRTWQPTTLPYVIRACPRFLQQFLRCLFLTFYMYNSIGKRKNEVKMTLLFSSIFKNYGKKIFLSHGTFLYAMFANYGHIERCLFTFLNVNFS